MINSFSAAHAALDRVQGRGDLFALIDVVDEVMDFACLASRHDGPIWDGVMSPYLSATASDNYHDALSAVIELRPALTQLEREVCQCA